MILAKEVRLDELREWEVGVVEMKMTPSAENIYICCDFVEPSIVDEYYFPVLRRLLPQTNSLGDENDEKESGEDENILKR